MSEKQLGIVVLAAGQGKRMNNPDIPKVLAELKCKPLIAYLIDQIVKLNPSECIFVVGHQKEKVEKFVSAYIGNKFKFNFAHQMQQLGTANAVGCSKEYLNNFVGNVLILCGDVPLLKVETLNNFIENHISEKADLSVLSMIAPNPKGYGRIIRNELNSFNTIIEEKDASDSQKLINEVNSGVYLVDSKILFEALSKVKNENAQKEYYLTDIVSIALNEGKKVIASSFGNFNQLRGINTHEELVAIEKLLD